MTILVSAAGMIRMALLCFVLGIVLGVYFGVSGSQEAEPTPARSVDGGTHVEATAP